MAADTQMHEFIEKVMHIDSDYAGMGGASAGILGATGTNGQIGFNVRAQALAFAAEYAKRPCDRKEFAEKASKLEGALRSLRLIDAISDTKLDELVAELRFFTEY